MNKLDIALNEFKTLIKNIDKDELKSIVSTIDEIDGHTNSYAEYLSNLDEEYSYFYKDIHEEFLCEKEFTPQNYSECKPEVIKYKNNFKAFDFKSFDIVVSIEVSNQTQEVYPDAA
ncbi:MAG: hypothetical protein JEZ14_24325 [Marinilabiliaceae bacterium]|nr:hypothetical protein [Marinilabiliaceae bacterium]